MYHTVDGLMQTRCFMMMVQCMY